MTLFLSVIKVKFHEYYLMLPFYQFVQADVQVEFEARPPEPDDFHGIFGLLRQVCDIPSFFNAFP